MNFDELIKKTVIRENELYAKDYDEKYFKVCRRTSQRLHLICRFEELRCNFSIKVSIIKHGNVKITETNHSCKIQFCKKAAYKDAPLLVSSKSLVKPQSSTTIDNTNKAILTKVVINNGFERSSESKDTTTRDQVIIQTSTTTSTSDDDFIWSGVANEFSGSTLSVIADTGSDLPMGTTTSDQVIIQTSTTTSTSDDDFIWSADSSIDCTASRNTTPESISSSSEYVLSSEDCFPASRDTFQDLVRSCKDKSLAFAYAKNAASISEEHKKHLDNIMADFDTLKLSLEQKSQMAASLSYLLQPNFGRAFVRRLFCSYDRSERDCMLLDLLMLRSMHCPKIKEVHIPTPLSSTSINEPSNSKKRKAMFEGDEYDSDEEVTYLDKPHQILS